MSGSSRWEDGGRGSPPLPGLDSLWARYGPWFERHVAASVGDDDRKVRVACYLTMVEAGRGIVDGELPRSPAGVWSWFERTAVGVCRRVREGDYDEAAIPDAPLPEALPSSLRSAVRRRQMREWFEWRFGAFVVLGLLPRSLLRGREVLGRGARAVWRRVGASVAPGAPNASGAIGAAAGSGLSEAVAAAAAVVILGLGGGVAEPPADDLSAAVSDITYPFAVLAVTQTTEASLPEPTGSPVDARSSEHDPSAPATAPSGTEQTSPEERSRTDLEAPATPVVNAKASERVEEPTDSETHDNGKEWTVNHEPVTSDVDGDGESDLILQPPVAGIDCPPPEERGLVTSVACDGADRGSLDR